MVHYAQPVRERERFFLIVRDEQERDADAALDGFQFRADLFAQVGIERGERLVEQQNVGFEHQRAGQRDALPFAAGKLGGAARFLAGQLNQIEHVANTIGDAIARAAPQAEFDVVAHGQMRKERVVLEDRADVALVGLQMLDAGAVQANFARSRLFKACDQTQRGGFSASGGAEQREELAARKVQRNTVDGVVRGIVLRNVAKL